MITLVKWKWLFLFLRIKSCDNKSKDFTMFVIRSHNDVAVCNARYKTRPGLSYHYNHFHNGMMEPEEPEPSPKSVGKSTLLIIPSI